MHTLEITLCAQRSEYTPKLPTHTFKVWWKKIDTKTEPFTQYNKLKGEKFIFIDSLWMAGWDEKCVYLMKD